MLFKSHHNLPYQFNNIFRVYFLFFLLPYLNLIISVINIDKIHLLKKGEGGSDPFIARC